MTSSTPWPSDFDEQYPSLHTPSLPSTVECPLGTTDSDPSLVSIDFSLPITTTEPRTGGLHSYFHTLHHRKRSYDADVQVLPFPPKRARIQPPPNPQPSLCTISKSKDAPKPLNQLSKTVANKRELNKAIEAGMFKRDQRKWAKFKMKISEIDPLSEVDNDNPKHVRKMFYISNVGRLYGWLQPTMFLCSSITSKAASHKLQERECTLSTAA
jgi:hypothetical protein